MAMLTTTNRQVIKEVPWGVYVWQLETGEFLVDDDNNFMLIPSTEGDKDRIQKLRDAAKHYGFPDGKPVFWSGRRPVTDEELEHQLARAAAGLVPDPLDIAAIKEEEAALKRQ